MKGYSEKELFYPHALEIWRWATRLVEVIPESLSETLRCHELAAATCKRINERFSGTKVVDGKYGAVEHSWLEIDGGFPVLLDVYCVGRLPMVQLVDRSYMLPHRQNYVQGPCRADLRQGVVDMLYARFKEVE